MTPMEPSAFAAQLVSRLEKLKREQDAMSSLEERLQQIQEVREPRTSARQTPRRQLQCAEEQEEEEEEEEEEGARDSGSLSRFSCVFLSEEEREEGVDLAASPSLHHPLLPPSSQCEEDPQAILDEHLSRVLKTPGCQSPGVVRHSPRSRSPDRTDVAAVTVGCRRGPPSPFFDAYAGADKVPMAAKPSTKHIHHHYIHHHHAGLRTKEQIEAEAARRVQCLCPPGGANYSDFTPA
ncbi:Axin-2 [Liparis tanakae]|uniref:Axin-2 n=1 Tax=Liparis tanakae TaxID=230148 RepID=A0A4Z2E6U9_9TELE|nr:Axin-2 [Liparis tanakae]